MTDILIKNKVDKKKLLSRITAIECDMFEFRSACDYILESGSDLSLHALQTFVHEIQEYMDATVKMSDVEARDE